MKEPGGAARDPAGLRAAHLGAKLAARIRGVLAAVWLAAFCAGFALPATELPETAALAALLARTQPLHALQKTILGHAGIAAMLASALVASVVFGGVLVFGRFHCSMLCPLGSCQDIAARLASGFRSPRRGPARPIRHGDHTETGRWIVAGLTIGGLAVGLPAAATFLEPYTLFARGFQQSFGDLAALGLNLAAALGVPIPIITIRWEAFAFALAVLPFGAVLAAATYRSRFYCSQLCPTGTLLGALNRTSFIRVRLDREACIDCGACSRICRTHCVDGRELDASRCVQCLDCVAVCPTGALRFGLPPRTRKGGSIGVSSGIPSGLPVVKTGKDGSPGTITPDAKASIQAPQAIRAAIRASRACQAPQAIRDPSRRRFLAGAGAAATGAALALAAPVSTMALGLPLVRSRPLGVKGRPLASPPGALSVDRFAGLCTACGTCIRACPSGVLRHSTFEYGFGRPGVPYLDYDRAFCQYECVACTAACPSGAIMNRSPELKKREAIGKSELILAECIVVSKGSRCGACAEHCPTGAVRIETVEGRPLPVPVLHVPTCIGCGACETVCPATPVKAITSSGLSVHELAEPPRKDIPVSLQAPPEKGFAF